jgi:hypothetical protein
MLEDQNLKEIDKETAQKSLGKHWIQIRVFYPYL